MRGAGRKQAEVRSAQRSFGAGVHKCSGYSLAMIEIPVVLALVLREYEMELLDPLPPMDYQQAFGLIGAVDQPTRVRYKRRQR